MASWTGDMAEVAVTRGATTTIARERSRRKCCTTPHRSFRCAKTAFALLAGLLVLQPPVRHSSTRGPNTGDALGLLCRFGMR